jgi:lipoprotein-anchoring transpeptidase ErfK/SrfK
MQIRISVLFVLLLAASSGADLSTNLQLRTVPKFFTAVHDAGLEVTSGLGGGIVVYQASESAPNLTDAQIQDLAEHVRGGSSLLILLDRNPGTMPMRLGFLLPTTAWGTQIRRNTVSGALNAAYWDSEVFPHGSSLSVPFYFDIRPLAAIERGQARYERFAETIPYVNLPVAAGNNFWTRPLLNRDWKIRIGSGDAAHMPLLVTGQYGAGRVAVFASSADALETHSDLWADLLHWLIPGAEKPVQTAAVVPTLDLQPVKNGIIATISNPGNIAAKWFVLMRALTWEHALIGDVEQSITVPPNANVQVKLPLPSASPTNYQALDFQHAFDLRVGVLSENGSALLAEKGLSADLTPPVQISVRSDNLNAWKYPFHASGPDLPLFRNRMGARVTAYAYPGGAEVHAEIEISNGMRNLAPLAKVTDETSPQNPSTDALTDGAMFAEKPPIDNLQAYGAWQGKEGQENSLLFTFPHPVTLTGVVLVGSFETERSFRSHNPGTVVLESGAKRVAQADLTDSRFAAGNGRLVLEFPPVTTTGLRVRMPWVASLPDGKKRLAPWLGEIEVRGFEGNAAPRLESPVSLQLIDALTGASVPVGSSRVSIDPGSAATVPVTFPMPKSNAGLGFYRLKAQCGEAVAEIPLLQIDPAHPLAPLSDLHPPDAASIGFIVTRGFRNTFDIGTGTRETGPGWGQPDDLIWAYSRQLKQIGANAKTEANRLYVTESDQRHYSTPWRAFPNGDLFFDAALPSIVESARKNSNWNKSKVVIFGFSDRWDTGPQMSGLNGWQDFVEFDEHVRALGLGGIESKDRQAVASEIHRRFENEWQAWQLDRYVNAIRELRSAFAKEGKTLIISAQGLPMVAGPAAVELAGVIRGMSDDSTWGMADNSVALTTGRQMAEMAFNPVWAMSTLLQWGFNSSLLNNPQWHAPVGTTEPTRRHYYDRAWRAMVAPDGSYRSLYSYGFNSNAGVSFTMTENDWQQWWQLEERHSLISPEEPLGAGLVMSSSSYAAPNHIRFTGGGETTESNDAVRTAQQLFRLLNDAGVSIPFSTNISALAGWKGNAPLIVTNLEEFSSAELETLRQLHDRGVRLAAFAKVQSLRPEARALFETPGTILLPAAGDFTASQARQLAPRIQQVLDIPVRFPEGTAGYGFQMSGVRFLVIEDWLEQGRVAAVRLHATAGKTTARAIDVNDHTSLPVRRDGSDWVIEAPLRPGDGMLLAIAEGN